MFKNFVAAFACLFVYACAADVGCDIEQTLLDNVESEMGVVCPDVRPQDNEAICTEGVAVGLDREKHTATVWYNVNHYPSAQWGVIQCVDACGGCDVLRGNGWGGH